MNFRPNDWKNPYHRALSYYSSEMYPATYKDVEEIYEDGADATLKAVGEWLEKWVIGEEGEFCGIDIAREDIESFKMGKFPSEVIEHGYPFGESPKKK